MIRTKTAAAAALLGGIAMLGACTAVDSRDQAASDPLLAGLDTQRACFSKRLINGYGNAPGDTYANERIVLDVGVREQWLLETTGACPDLDFSRRLALDTFGGTSVCTGDLETLLVPSSLSGGVDRCPVRVLGRLPDD